MPADWELLDIGPEYGVVVTITEERPYIFPAKETIVVYINHTFKTALGASHRKICDCWFIGEPCLEELLTHSNELLRQIGKEKMNGKQHEMA